MYSDNKTKELLVRKKHPIQEINTNWLTAITNKLHSKFGNSVLGRKFFEMKSKEIKVEPWESFFTLVPLHNSVNSLALKTENTLNPHI